MTLASLFFVAAVATEVHPGWRMFAALGLVSALLWLALNRK